MNRYLRNEPGQETRPDRTKNQREHQVPQRPRTHKKIMVSKTN